MRSIAVSVLVVFCAFLIDAFQFLLGWAFFILGMVAPTAGGAIIGNQYCPDGVLNGACQVVAVGVGFLINLVPGVAEVGGAIGTAVGMAMGVVVAWTLGPVLCVFLFLTGRFNARYMLPAFAGETLPFLSYIPAWTAATVASVVVYHTKAVAAAAIQKVAGSVEEAPFAAPAFAVARFATRNAPPREMREGAERAGRTRAQLLENIPPGTAAPRPGSQRPNVEGVAPPRSSGALRDDSPPFDHKYGLAV